MLNKVTKACVLCRQGKGDSETMRLEVMGDEQDLLEELPVRVDAIRVFERMIFGSQRTQWTKICFACGSPSF